MPLFIRKIAFTLSILLFGLILYNLKYKDQSESWKNYQKPELAMYTSLDEDEIILEELNRQTAYKTYKVMDPTLFTKPNIFTPKKTL